MIPFLVLGSALDMAENIEATMLVDLCCSRLHHATVHLWRFDALVAQSTEDVDPRANWLKEREETRAIRDRLLAARGPVRTSFLENLQMEVEVTQEHLESRLRAGILPRAIETAALFAHAEGFIAALHTVRSAVRALRAQDDFEKPASEAVAAMDEAVPHLVGVRNSIAHVDDRLRRLKSHGRKIEPRPIEIPGLISGPAGGIAVGSLVGRDYFTMCEDGEQHSVRIDQTTLFAVRDILQTFLDQLPWRHPGSRSSPSG